MNPRFNNFSVALLALTVVSVVGKIASTIKVAMAGYPPPTVYNYGNEETSEETPEPINKKSPPKV